MKKFLVITLCLLMAASVMLVGCSKEEGANEGATVKFGAGLYVSAPTTADATADKNGSGKIESRFGTKFVKISLRSCKKTAFSFTPPNGSTRSKSGIGNTRT